MVPPVPIPNTVVKHINAEGTWLETAWEIRELPVRGHVFAKQMDGKGGHVFARQIHDLYGGRGEAVNTLDCGSSMRGFDPHQPPHYRGIAQLVE